MAFWHMIKQGSDIFEVTRHEPKVDVCDKHYVFDAVTPAGAAPNFSPRAACPAYQLPKEIAAAVKEKQAEDERKMADHVQRGAQTVAVRTGSDGGMHPTFLARLKPKNPWDAFSSHSKVVGAQPGDMGNNVNPPRESAGDDGATASVRIASSPMNESGSSEKTESAWDRLTSSVARTFNPGAAEGAQPEPRAAAVPTPKPRVAQKPASSTVAQAAKPAAKPQQVAADNKSQQMAEAPTPTDNRTATTNAPAPPSSTFDGRWSTFGR
jgi:hypothetical protein